MDEINRLIHAIDAAPPPELPPPIPQRPRWPIGVAVLAMAAGAMLFVLPPQDTTTLKGAAAQMQVDLRVVVEHDAANAGKTVAIMPAAYAGRRAGSQPAR